MLLMFHVLYATFKTEMLSACMIPAKYTCLTGWTREYFGYLMSEQHKHHRSQFFCVDHSLTLVIGSSYDYLFSTVEGVCGSLPCPPYSRDKELSCAVCTK